MRPALLVTIDTEEEGLWSNQYRSDGNTVANLRGIPRFQELCDEFHVRPTYFVDSPVITDDFGRTLLRGLQEDGRAEIGGHLHPWCTPPFEEELTPRNSYLCNLPETLQFAKLTTLTNQIEAATGRRPTSFRAGRYGLGPAAARILSDLGYVVDSSVIPFSDFTRNGGPDFSRAPWKPYRMSLDDVLKTDPRGKLLELPVGQGFSGRDFESSARWQRKLRQSALARWRIPGLLDRLGWLRRVKLSPEQADAPSMCRLIDSSLAQGNVSLVLMFHSSSLQPGFSPYVPSPEKLEEFHRRLRSVFDHCVNKRSLSTPTMTEFARTFP